MKPYEEQDAIDALRNIRRLIGRIRETDLLECLARDDQPNNSRDPDPFHKAVSVGICKKLEIASQALQNAVNTTKYLLDKTSPGRQTTLVDCLACGKAVLSQIKSGFCSDCWEEWRAYSVKSPQESHFDFIQKKRAESGTSDTYDKIGKD
jgi:hypothetical protein